MTYRGYGEGTLGGAPFLPRGKREGSESNDNAKQTNKNTVCTSLVRQTQKYQ